MDTAILKAIQDGVPLTENPFQTVAEQVGIGEDELLSRLRRLREVGVIRRFAASINNRKIGIVANAMIAWRVPEGRVEEVGVAFSKNSRVTHCYERKTLPGRWGYNLFTVLHGYDREAVAEIVKDMAKSVGVDEYLILFSRREFKRSSNGRVDRRILNISVEGG